MNSSKFLNAAGFFAVTTLGVYFVFTLIVIAPLLAALFLLNWGSFLFFLVGSTALGLYYSGLYLIMGGIIWLHRIGPHKLITASFISLSSLYSIFNIYLGMHKSYINHGSLIPWDPLLILSMVAIVPGILFTLFIFVVMPFLLNERIAKQIN